MIKTNLRNAWRVLLRNKSYTFINVLGLSLSIGISLVIFQVIRFETGFDAYHARASRIYQLTGKNKFGEANPQAPQGVLHALNTKFPGVEKAAAVYRFDPQVVKTGDRNFKQTNVFFTQPAFLDMIDVEWIVGSPAASLGKPFQIVLDEPTAHKLFGGDARDAVGKTLRFDKKIDLTVSGIIKKSPANSDFQLEMMVSFATLTKYLDGYYGNEDSWGGGDSFFHGYVLLKPGADPKTIEAGLDRMAAEKGDESAYTHFFLSSLNAAHFNGDLDEFNYTTSRWILYALGSIGAFLVLIACINFINMATVQAVQRNKETGIRKLLGSSKSRIIGQFLVETGLIVLLAMILGIGLGRFFQPYTESLVSSHVNEGSSWSVSIIPFLLLLGVLITLLAGLYPALSLSGFKPVELLRQKFFTGNAKGITLRRSLVVIQFTIAQVLVICTLVGMRQIHYFYQKDLGFDQASMVTVTMPDRGDALMRERFRQALIGSPAIREITYGLTAPSSRRHMWWGKATHPGLPNGELFFRLQFVDTNYFSFFKIPLVAGRNLTRVDTNGIALVNETAARDMGFKNPAGVIGQQPEIWGERKTIIGVVKDYQSQSLKEGIIPHIFEYGPGKFETACIRVEPGKTTEALKQIGIAYKILFPDNVFEYAFLGDDVKSFYADESKLANFLSLFTIIGLLTGCLGLYGLVSFICVRKTKEIGVRKVLGAGIPQILSLLSGEFLALVGVSFVVSMPLAWWIMKHFLEQYSNRIAMPFWIFGLSGAGAVVLTMLTISLQTVRAALVNPAKSLRTE